MSSRCPFVLTPACRDSQGIVFAVSGALCRAGCNTLESQRFGDLRNSDATGLFFLPAWLPCAQAHDRGVEPSHKTVVFA